MCVCVGGFDCMLFFLVVCNKYVVGRSLARLFEVLLCPSFGFSAVLLKVLDMIRTWAKRCVLLRKLELGGEETRGTWFPNPFDCKVRFFFFLSDDGKA